MAMKHNDKNKLQQANKIFTDRDEPRKVFWDNYNTFKNNLQNNKDNEIKLITYYGIGGMGKSRLLKQLRTELNEYVKSPLYISIDFEENHDMLSILMKIRNLLQNSYNYNFPMFDLAYYTYMQKQGHNIKHEEFNGFISSSPILDSILDVSSVLPGVGTIIGIIKGLDSLSTAIRNNLITRKRELNEINNDEPDTLINNMPYYLACDIESNLEQQTEPLIIFIDSYEVLVNELSNIGDQLNKDKWLRHEERGLIVNIHNTIWVIAGRDKLKWEQINPDWEGTIEQHLLGSLSDFDAETFLYGAGISDRALVNEIYNLTRGVPLYLDICVDRYYSIIEKGLKPSMEDIGSNTHELISRFVKYMDDNKKALVYILSCLEDWTDELLDILIQVFLPAIPFTTIANIKNYSFIMTDDNRIYKMHQSIQNIVYSDCDKNISTKVNIFMKEYYYKLLTGDFSIISEYANLLMKYTSYSLRCGFKSEDDFVDFYKTSFLPLNKNLLKFYQYNESLSILEQLISYVSSNFSKGISISYCLLNYAISQYLAGNYQEALRNSSISYECFKELLGEEHSDTLKAMKILIIAYRKIGQYQISLSMSKELYNIRERISGANHPTTIDELINLAISFRKYGDFKEAIKVSEKVMDYKLNTLGENHPSTISAMGSLANSYRQSGENLLALQLSEKIVNLNTIIYGKSHPSTLAAIGSLAHSYRLMEKFELATELSEKLVDSRSETLGEWHPLTLRAMNNLSNSYRKIEKFSEALNFAEKVVNLRKELLGDNHPSTIGAMSNLATSYRLIGQYEPAHTLALQVYNWRNEKYGEAHPATLRAKNNLANSYRLIGNNDMSKMLLNSIIDIASSTYSSNHPSVIAAKHNLSYDNLIDLDEEDSEDISEESYDLLAY